MFIIEMSNKHSRGLHSRQETVQISGKTLAEEGLAVTIPNRYESKIFIYKIKH